MSSANAWNPRNIMKLVSDETRGHKRIPTADYQLQGRTPVVDQSQILVAGYTEELSTLTDPPYIVFGDHTREIKYLDQPFLPGAQGVRILKATQEADPKFLYHYLAFNKVQNLGYSRHFKLFKQIEIHLPPLAEQQRIAEILDQIEHLKTLNEEQNQLLSYSVGRSLIFELANLDTPKVKLSDISTISSGSTPSRKVSGYYGGSIPWVKTNEVNSREIFDTEEKLTEPGLEESSCRMYPAGTVLVAMYGQGATRGQAGILRVPAATNQACASVVPHDLDDSEFIFEALKANYEQLRSLGRGGTQPNLNLGLVKNFQIPYPSKEQRQEFREKIAAVNEIKLLASERSARITEASEALKSRAFAGLL